MRALTPLSTCWFALVATLVLGLWLGSAQASRGQGRHYRVSVEQQVVAGELVLDFYVQRLRTDTLWLAASNFSLYMNASALDVSRAQVDHRFDGRWDDNYDGQGYFDVSVASRQDFLTFNINCRSQLTTQQPGRGQALLPTRERVGRVRVPITDPCQTAELRWRLEPMAIMEWDGTPAVQRGEFVPPSSTLELCLPPSKPEITPMTPLQVCSNAPAVLQTTAGPNRQWHRNGAPIAGATGTQLVVTETGRYSVQVTACSCTAPPSDTLAVEVTPAEAPEIWYAADGRLHTRPSAGLQWHLDGAPMTGATGASIPLEREGTYHVVLTNRCGSFASAQFVWLTTRPLVDPFALHPTAPTVVVHPNPYVAFTHLSYHLPTEAEVKVELNAATGVKLKTLLHERQAAGRYTLRINSRDHGLVPGTYFLSFIAGGERKTFKLIQVN